MHVQTTIPYTTTTRQTAYLPPPPPPLPSSSSCITCMYFLETKLKNIAGLPTFTSFRPWHLPFVIVSFTVISLWFCCFYFLFCLWVFLISFVHLRLLLLFDICMSNICLVCISIIMYLLLYIVNHLLCS